MIRTKISTKMYQTTLKKITKKPTLKYYLKPHPSFHLQNKNTNANLLASHEHKKTVHLEPELVFNYNTLNSLDNLERIQPTAH